MARVVIQVIDDTNEIEEEALVAGGVDIQEAKRVLSLLMRAPDIAVRCAAKRLVTEFHYKDGDVGAYDDINVLALWAHFSRGHKPSHIVIRPDTEEGQILSNRLKQRSSNRPLHLR